MACCSKRSSVAAVVTYTYPKTSRHMICDDSSQNRMILARILKKLLHVEVDEAENWEQAHALIKEHGEYAIIWQDFALGVNEPNGGEICTMLRTQYEYKGIIICLSGFTDAKTREACRVCGMNGFVAKPFNVKTVRELGEKHAYPPILQ